MFMPATREEGLLGSLQHPWQCSLDASSCDLHGDKAKFFLNQQNYRREDD